MRTIEQEVLVLHTPAQMFALVDKVEHYPRFLPWCSQALVHSREKNTVVASLHIDYLKIRQRLTTRNTYLGNDTILLELVDGPFDALQGKWRFLALGDRGCKVQFYLSYQFSNKLLEKLVGPVFGRISTTLVDAFIKEADRVYGKS